MQCRDGVVTIQGTVSDRRMKHHVEDLIERCSGVKDIENRLSVKRDNQQGQGYAQNAGLQSGSSAYQGQGQSQGSQQSASYDYGNGGSGSESASQQGKKKNS